MSDAPIQPLEEPGASKKARRFRASIATVLSFTFGVLLLVAGGTILRVGVQTGLDSVEALTVDKVLLILNAVSNRIKDHLNPAVRVTENLAEMVADGALEPVNGQMLPAVLEASISATPQVRSIVFVDTRGVALGFHASKTTARFQIEDWSSDEAVLRALENMHHSGESIWGPPTFVPSAGVTVLNIRTPVYRQGEFVGAFIAAVGVDELSRHMGDVMASAGEVPFVLSGPDRVIAHPTLRENRPGRTRLEPLVPLGDLNDPVLVRLWDETFTRQAGRWTVPAGYEARVVNVPDDEGEREFVVVFKRAYGLDAIPWTVGVHFPAETIGAQLIRLLRTSMAGVILLAIGIFATVLLAKAIARPVRRLSATAKQLEALGPEDVETLPSSYFREIEAANHAFNKMVLAMRERELILNLFGRFVPEQVARELIADRGTLEPQTREATVFFSDIAGFSTFSEGMKPEALNKLLNEYFELLGAILSRHNGVVQQFQGDGMLATFNMPVPDPDHAANAVRAAVDIQRALEGRTFQNDLSLPTRIGLNTGTMVGGTVGSASRKSYTVHGDAVNLASRIEQMNKKYKTRILVAESTVRAAGDVFRFEPIGEVPVRGRNQTVRLFRVLDFQREDLSAPRVSGS